MIDYPLTSKNIFHDVEIGIGTWSWGDRLFWGYGYGYKDEDLRAAFQQSIEMGIVFFDTAEVYGQGKSEQYLGCFLKEFNPSIKISTKFIPYPWRLTRSSLILALKGSLKRLGLSKVDLYQIHFPFPPISIEIWMDTMVEACQAGLTDAVGISNCDRNQMQRAYDALIHQGVSLASNQVEYHLLNRKIEKNGLLKHCLDLGASLIAYSPLGQGLLSGKYSPTNPPRGIRSARYNPKYLQRIQPLITILRKVGVAHGGMTPAQVSLNWVMCKGAIPIPGAKNAIQALENAGARGWRLNEEEIQLLDDISDRVINE